MKPCLTHRSVGPRWSGGETGTVRGDERVPHPPPRDWLNFCRKVCIATESSLCLGSRMDPIVRHGLIVGGAALITGTAYVFDAWRWRPSRRRARARKWA